MDMLLIILSIVVFTGIILVLVLLLSFAESKLIKQGDCNLVINEDKDNVIKVKAGSSLLTTLSNQKIFLPSACGGGGTCAMCKCQVHSGGGELLETEKSHISRQEAKDGWRLSCQVKVKENMSIQVPDEIFTIQKFECTVASNNNVATFIKELILNIDGGKELKFQAGGYIQIDIPKYKLSFKNFDIPQKYREDWDTFKLWDIESQNTEECFRAYSMANHPAEGNRVMLNIRIATPPPNTVFAPGVASSYIFNLKLGDKAVISGPYGEFFQKRTKREMCFIAGGAGMAPMRSHLFDLFHTQNTDRKVSFWYGARSVRENMYVEDFEGIQSKFSNFKYQVAMSSPLPEDQWEGAVGFIHNVVYENYLKNHEEPEEIEYYLCGPPMMVDATTKMLEDLGVEKKMIAYDAF